MGKNKKQEQARSGGSNKKRLDHDGKLRLIAFTDASVSEHGEATAAIILMGVKQNFIHSAHIMNFGYNLNVTQVEMLAMITALRVAPDSMLETIMCDNEGAVASLKKHRYRPSSMPSRLLSKDDLEVLDKELARNRAVKFECASRSENNVKLADKFSRYARGKEPGIISEYPAKELSLYEQKNQLFKDLS